MEEINESFQEKQLAIALFLSKWSFGFYWVLTLQGNFKIQPLLGRNNLWLSFAVFLLTVKQLGWFTRLLFSWWLLGPRLFFSFFLYPSSSFNLSWSLSCCSAWRVVFNLASMSRVLSSRMVKAGTVTCRCHPTVNHKPQRGKKCSGTKKQQLKTLQVSGVVFVWFSINTYLNINVERWQTSKNTCRNAGWRKFLPSYFFFFFFVNFPRWLLLATFRCLHRYTHLGFLSPEGVQVLQPKLQEHNRWKETWKSKESYWSSDERILDAAAKSCCGGYGYGLWLVFFHKASNNKSRLPSRIKA